MRRCNAVLLLALLSALGSLAPAPADAARLRLDVVGGYGKVAVRPGDLALPRGSLLVDDDVDGPVLGLRLVGRRKDQLGWAVEVAQQSGRFAHAVTVDPRPTQVLREQWTVDASVERRWMPFHGGRGCVPRTTLILLGGPGVALRSTDAEEFERTRSTSATAHAGFGAAFQVGERTFLRADTRARWLAGGDTNLQWETTLSIGWTIDFD